MSSKRKTSGEASPEVKLVERPVKPAMVTLRLKQNDFVHGEFAKKGTTFEFTRKEADKRLQTTQKWEYPS